MGGTRVRLTAACRRDIKNAIKKDAGDILGGAVIEFASKSEMKAVKSLLCRELGHTLDPASKWKWGNPNSYHQSAWVSSYGTARIHVRALGHMRFVGKGSLFWGVGGKFVTKVVVQESNFIDEYNSKGVYHGRSKGKADA